MENRKRGGDNRTMKVAYILNVFPKISETFVLNEMIAMQKKGVEIEAFVYADPKEPTVHSGFKQIKNVTYFSLPKGPAILQAHFYFLLRNTFRYFQAFWLSFMSGRKGIFSRSGDGLGKLFCLELYDSLQVAKAKPDHIHAHFGDYRASNLAMMVSWLTGIPYTFTTHAHDIFDTPPNNYGVKTKFAKKHITISRYNKKYLVDHFQLDADKIAVIHCGVDFDRLPPPEKGPKQNIILSIARLAPEKALDNLVRACRILKEEGVVFECWIIGEGPEESKILSVISELSLEKEVKLLGAKIQEEVFEFLKKSAVKVLPSRRTESMGVALMEAMALGVPVVGPRLHGVPELVEDGKCGFLADPDNVPMLADRIKRLLTDESSRRSFIEAGYKKVYDEFNLKTETDKLFRIWSS